MIRAHLTPTEYRRMPWANGRGETLELLRREGAEGQLLLRLSVAQVVEDGDFSRLPGIDRVLTVISGPGFDLAGGGLRFRADPLCPVAFSGDVEIAAEGVAAPSEDFNLMLARGAATPDVRVLSPEEHLAAPVLALFLLDAAQIALPSGPVTGGARDLLIVDGEAGLISGGPAVAVPLPTGLI